MVQRKIYARHHRLPRREDKGLKPLASYLQPLIQRHCVTPEKALTPSTAGFDAVIGNPPYIRIQSLKEHHPEEAAHYKGNYVSGSKGNFDIYVLFVERGLDLLNERGRLGLILPHKFFNAKYGESLRKLVADGRHLAHVVHFADQQVFKGATTYTCLMFLDKPGVGKCAFTKVSDLKSWRTEKRAGEPPSEPHSSLKPGSDGASPARAESGLIPVSRITRAEWNFNVGKGAGLFDKLSQMPLILGSIARLFVGLQTDADDVFILEEIRRQGDKVFCKSKASAECCWFENDHLKLLLKGSLNVGRYNLSNVTKRLIFPYQNSGDQSTIISDGEYAADFPLTWEYLKKNEERLKSRNRGHMGTNWHGYVYKKNHTRFTLPKLLVPSIGIGSCFSADLNGSYYFVGSGGGGGGGYGITLLDERRFSLLYLLGILNSKAISAYLISISTPFRGGYYALNRQYIAQLPIRTINLSDAADRSRHDEMVKLVDRMLDLHKRLAKAKTQHDKTVLQRQIDATDTEIDRLVYDLYGLTEAEIRIVED